MNNQILERGEFWSGLFDLLGFLIILPARKKMGQGIDLARPEAPEHAAVLDNFKDQLLILFLKRLGGEVSMPLSEVDDTSQDLLAFSINDGIFHFELRKKQ